MNEYFISHNNTVKQAMKRIGKIGKNGLFIVDQDNKLQASVTDGDIRRWILKGGRLDELIENVCNYSPRVIDESVDEGEIKKLLLERKFECLPLVDADGIIQKVYTLDDFLESEITENNSMLNVPIVIMAGGKGTRLDPFTKILPKPLIPIGGKPIIEIIMDRFGKYGIKEFYITINHKAKMIKSYFEEMNHDRYDIHYIEEEKPLGTSGGLKYLDGKFSGSVVVTNCDIVVESDYRELMDFHDDNDFDLTLVTSYRHYVIPYGICEIENGGTLKNINEKPEYDLLVNTGMYVVRDSLIKLIPSDEFFNVTDLISLAQEQKCSVGVFPINEKSWIDIGQWEEYHKALKVLSV